MKVLVALDNKPSSQATIDALIKMRWSEGTEVIVVTVLPASTKQDASLDLDATAREIESLAVELQGALRYCEVSFFARPGHPHSVILELAEQLQVDLIVLGSNCKSTVERLILGSVSQSVLNGAKCPVIVAKTPCCVAREEFPSFRNVLVTIDNSTCSDVAIDWLHNFQWGPETKFTLAAIVEEDTDINVVRQTLNSRAARLSKAIGTTNVFVEIAVGEPRLSIVKIANEYYVDLILMGSHGHAGIKESILGSVAHGVAHSAQCAVVVARPTSKAKKSCNTGDFPKLKPISLSAYKGSFREDRQRSDVPGHVMPGGF